MKVQNGCPVTATANALRGKWKVQIVWHLSFGPLRFAAVRDLLPGVSEKVLTEHLRQLETDGIVLRTVLSAMPLWVEYDLTAAGKELVPILQAMCDWASAYKGLTPNLRRPAAADSRMHSPIMDNGPL